MNNGLIWAAYGTAFTFLMTALGAAVVLLFRRLSSGKSQKAFLGFASGVMIAASVWSLLIPCITMAEENGVRGYIPAAGGFILGVIFMLIFDRVIGRIQKNAGKKSTALLITAITIHNIPEGMAVGLSFALAAMSTSTDNAVTFAPAIALALGIGIQNFPEGAAVSLPLKQSGMSSKKAFSIGALSGIVEPIFGILAVLIAGFLVPYLPWLLSLAAGAMLYVVIEELVPEAHDGEFGKIGTIGAMVGFLIMMVLDIALG